MRLHSDTTGEPALIAFGLATQAHRLTSGVSFHEILPFASSPSTSSMPLWLRLFAYASGLTWAACEWDPPAPVDRRVRWTSVLAFVLLVLSGRDGLLSVVGSCFIAASALGFATGRIATQGKTGPVHKHTGAAAYLHSGVFFVAGLF